MHDAGRHGRDVGADGVVRWWPCGPGEREAAGPGIVSAGPKTTTRGWKSIAHVGAAQVGEARRPFRSVASCRIIIAPLTWAAPTCTVRKGRPRGPSPADVQKRAVQACFCGPGAPKIEG